MKILYFDLTNIVRFAESNDHVTGIQRVQLQLITDLVRIHGSARIRGLAYVRGHQANAGWRDIDLGFLLEQHQFNAVEFLLAAGAIQPSRLPSRDQVKRHLVPYENHKILRGLRKLGIYATALVSKQRLRAQGFALYSEQACASACRSRPFERMAPEDTFAILGETGANPETEQQAIEHHRAGGLVVQMVHDLIPITQPALHTARTVRLFTQWLEGTSAYVGRFLCVSRYTAKDLSRFLSARGIDIPVEVTPLAHEFSGYPRDADAAPPGAAAERDYVLCVGSIEVRKNGLALLQAWSQVLQELGDSCPCLIFAGKKGWKIDGFHAMLNETGYLGGKVIIIESPSDSDLVGLYRHCLFTVFPSLHEGWGLPVGEGAWFNKFGVVSRASSIPEVCGDLVDYIDPNNIDDIANALLRPLKDPIYLERRTKQVKHASLRTWKDVAMNVYDHLYTSPVRKQVSATNA